MKDVKNFWDKFLYVPWPGYSSRHRIWTTLMEKALDGDILPDDLDVSSLARVSAGYTAGSISYAIKKTLTKRRIQMMPLRELEETEFLNALSRCPRTQETDEVCNVHCGSCALGFVLTYTLLDCFGYLCVDVETHASFHRELYEP